MAIRLRSHRLELSKSSSQPPEGEEKANRNTSEIRNRCNSFKTQNITFSNRNKNHCFGITVLHFSRALRRGSQPPTPLRMQPISGKTIAGGCV
jgi:hypothetical protein